MKYLILSAALAAASLSAPALGQTTAPNNPSDTAMVDAASMSAATSTTQAPSDPKSPMLTNDELDSLRGGETLVITNQTLNAITSGNILNGDYAAGAVTLSDNALSNFNGVGNLLINTGAQVSVQSGMNLTINLAN
ncbi:hypothetical protein CDQ91_00560 [Sphingopyxis witflariensis]|uniref:Endonuclease n=2 Tax=Sphingopyxis witflariensis TaxID=173675 RepID=A0A246K586_9SPHN|nr:hypothetical protein CDQ91_00560 [Sphingopyxis witflariensis]